MNTKQNFYRLLKNKDANYDCLKIMLIVAHPDDEVVGVGSLLWKLSNIQVVHATDGAPRNMTDALASGCTSRPAYAKKRRMEAESALNLVGYKSPHCISLGFVDQEASLNLPGLSLRIAELAECLKCQVILTHAYEGGHPDHDAVAFSVWAACRLLQMESKTVPDVVEFASYHGDGTSRIVTNQLIPVNDSEIVEIKLGNVEQNLKKQMIECFESQKNVLSEFTVKYEQLRIAPSYNFTCLPHDGMLYYDYFQWGMNSHQWIQLASEAIRVLGLGETRK